MRFKYIIQTVLVTVVIAVSLFLTMSLTNSGAKTQEQKRTVVRKPWRVEPVKVVAVKNKKKANIEIGKPFDDDDDWLDGFTVSVLNESDKVVTAVTIEMIFRREAGDIRPPVAQPLHFGISPFRHEYTYRDRRKVIKVGDTADLQLSEENYASLKKLLEQLGYASGVKKVELEIREIGFEDGSALLSGTLWLQDPNDPDDPTRKIPAERLKPQSPRHHAISPRRTQSRL
jgi:hypothetical protein